MFILVLGLLNLGFQNLGRSNYGVFFCGLLED